MIYLFIALLFSLFVAIFAVQNSLAVTVSFLGWSFETSLVIVILGSATFGALAILSLAMTLQVKSRWVISKVRHRVSELEAEVSRLTMRLAQETGKERCNKEEM